MEELQLALTTARVEQRNFGLWINNWQIGQTLNALVSNQLPTGELVLRVGGQQITATADIPIQQGSNLLLEVKQLNPVPTLRVINPTATPAAAVASGTLQLLSISGDGLATQPLGAVAQSLQASLAGSALPAGLVDSVSELLRQVNRSDRLGKAEGLSTALRDSGLFLESKLRAADGPQAHNIAQDFKGLMFKALGRVNGAVAGVDALALNAADAQALMEMKRELEAGLGRIIVHQLNSQPVEGQSGRSWQVEIPVQHGGSYHSLRLELEHETARGGGSDEDGEQDRWRVRLAVSPPALGAVQVSLQLQGQEVGLRVSAAREPVRAILDAHLPRLERALASRGLKLNTSGVALLAETPRTPAEPPASSAGLDIKA